MASEDFCVEQWDGQVKILPAGRTPTGEDCLAGICNTWKTVAGDAGWAGVLAESALKKGPPMSVIFPPGTDTLGLVVEALGLLPPEKRWDVTFSTYFTKAPAGVDCQWRFLLDGTVEATALRRDMRAKHIDLTKPLEKAQGGELVEMARTGQTPRRAEATVAAPAQRVAPGRPRPAAPVAAQPETLPSEMPLSLAPPIPRGPLVSDLPAAQAAPSYLTSRKSLWITAAIPAVALILVTVLVLGVCLLTRGTGEEEIADVDDGQTSEPPTTSKGVAGDSGSTEKLAGKDGYPGNEVSYPKGQLPEDTQSEEFKPPPPKNEVAKPKSEKPETQPKETAKEKPKPRPKPFIDINAGQKKLGLPPQTKWEGTGIRRREKVNDQFIELTKLYVDDATPCSLKLVGEEFAARPGWKHVVVPADENGTRIWTVVSKVEKANREIEVGTFKLESDALWFRWLDPTCPVRLQYCLLDITVARKTERCTLNQVISVPPVRLNVDDVVARPKLEGVRTNQFREDDSFRIEFKLEGVEGARFVDNVKPSYEPKEKTRIRVPNPHIQSGGGNKELDVELIFVVDREQKGLFLETKLFARPTYYVPETDSFKEKEEQITEKRLGGLETEGASFIGQAVALIRRKGYQQIERWNNLDDDQRREKRKFAELVRHNVECERHLNDLLMNIGRLERKLRKRLKPEVEEKTKKELKQFTNKVFPAEQLAKSSKTALDQSVGEQKRENEIKRLDEDFALPGDFPGFENLTRNVEFYERAREFTEKNKKWCESMRKFVHQLADDARLHYRISLQSGDRTIHVAMTDAFDN